MNIKKIETIEYILTIGCVNIIPLVLTLPTFTSQIYGTGAMSHTIYVLLIDAITLYMFFNLFFKLDGMDLLEISEYVGGKALHLITCVLCILYLIISSTIVIAEFNENIRNILFDNAMKEYINIVFLVGILVGVLNGTKGVFRASTLIAPIIISSLIFMFLSLAKNIDYTNFTPILGNDIGIYFKTGIQFEYYEGLFIALLLGKRLKDPKRASFWSFIITSLIIIIVSILLFGIISYPIIKENYFPFFELSRLMSFGRFWQRVESIYTLIWLLAVFIYITIGPVLSMEILSKTFDLKYTYRIAPLISMIVIIISSLYSSYLDVINFSKIWRMIITPMAIFIYPLILVILSLKKRRTCHENNE